MSIYNWLFPKQTYQLVQPKQAPKIKHTIIPENVMHNQHAWMKQFRVGSMYSRFKAPDFDENILPKEDNTVILVTE